MGVETGYGSAERNSQLERFALQLDAIRADAHLERVIQVLDQVAAGTIPENWNQIFNDAELASNQLVRSAHAVGAEILGQNPQNYASFTREDRQALSIEIGALIEAVDPGTLVTVPSVVAPPTPGPEMPRIDRNSPPEPPVMPTTPGGLGTSSSPETVARLEDRVKTIEEALRERLGEEWPRAEPGRQAEIVRELQDRLGISNDEVIAVLYQLGIAQRLTEPVRVGIIPTDFPAGNVGFEWQTEERPPTSPGTTIDFSNTTLNEAMSIWYHSGGGGQLSAADRNALVERVQELRRTVFGEVLDTIGVELWLNQSMASYAAIEQPLDARERVPQQESASLDATIEQIRANRITPGRDSIAEVNARFLQYGYGIDPYSIHGEMRLPLRPDQTLFYCDLRGSTVAQQIAQAQGRDGAMEVTRLGALPIAIQEQLRQDLGLTELDSDALITFAGDGCYVLTTNPDVWREGFLRAQAYVNSLDRSPEPQLWLRVSEIPAADLGSSFSIVVRPIAGGGFSVALEGDPAIEKALKDNATYSTENPYGLNSRSVNLQMRNRLMMPLGRPIEEMLADINMVSQPLSSEVLVSVLMLNYETSSPDIEQVYAGIADLGGEIIEMVNEPGWVRLIVVYPEGTDRLAIDALQDTALQLSRESGGGVFPGSSLTRLTRSLSDLVIGGRRLQGPITPELPGLFEAADTSKEMYQAVQGNRQDRSDTNIADEANARLTRLAASLPPESPVWNLYRYGIERQLNAAGIKWEEFIEIYPAWAEFNYR